MVSGMDWMEDKNVDIGMCWNIIEIMVYLEFW